MKNNQREVIFLASDFKGIRFMDPAQCPFARAARRIFPNVAHVGINRIISREGTQIAFNSEDYCPYEYNSDSERAKVANYDPAVEIRRITVTLTENE